MPNPDNNLVEANKYKHKFHNIQKLLLSLRRNTYIRIPQVCAIVNLSLRFLLKKRIEKR